jgi:putative NADPH-quinone reductase
MSVVVNVFHPDLRRSRVNRIWAEFLLHEGVKVRDMSRIAPSGSYDVALEQSICDEADLIVLQSPLYWYSAPAMMKQWIEDVLIYGWAYGDQYALQGKKWLSAISVGGREEEYTSAGSRGYSVSEFLRPLERTAAFVKMEWTEPYLLYGSGYVSEAEIAASCEPYLRRIRALTQS